LLAYFSRWPHQCSNRTSDPQFHPGAPCEPELLYCEVVSPQTASYGDPPSARMDFSGFLYGSLYPSVIEQKPSLLSSPSHRRDTLMLISTPVRYTTECFQPPPATGQCGGYAPLPPRISI